MSAVQPWTSVLKLRPEVVARRGHAEGLQMSLYEAVHQTSDVPYRDASYWCDITEPTVKLVEFMADITRQLADVGDAGRLNLPGGGDSLIHLDQGMGGGKSHALVGLWHMVNDPETFNRSDIGQAVAASAERRAGQPVTIDDVRPVILCADRFSPGAPRPEYGPATNLHQRFLWSLFAGDRALYDAHVNAGRDKAAIADALRAAGRPVLILLDEVMDYALQLAEPEHRDQIPAEQAFLNALTEVVNETPQVVAVVVMIRSDLDEGGYAGPAAELREYLARRLERNGTTRSVNEPQDFAAIIRRRLFTRPDGPLPTSDLARAWASEASSSWTTNVFDKLPGAPLTTFDERLARSYPFHPDLLQLIEHDWTQHAGFQRVRSTVEVFAATSYYWTEEAAAGRWVPELIGVGDIPLHVAGEEVLGSGLLHGNERQVIGMRQVAEKDVTNHDRTDGQAVRADARLTDGRTWTNVQPQPATRMATALWMYSIAVRAHTRRGATKAELLAAVYVPDPAFTFGDAEEVFNALTDPDDETSLGALDVIPGAGGNNPTRYVLSTAQNKLSFQRNALGRTTPDDSYDLIWERVQQLATKGPGFDQVLFVDDGAPSDALADTFSQIDQRRSNRLVVLHPRRWTLLNGRDSQTRNDIDAVLGVGTNPLPLDFAASCVIACVNTQRRDPMVRKARHAFAWQLATSEVERGTDLHTEMAAEARRSEEALDVEIRRAYQHVVYLVRDDDGLRADYLRFEDDTKSSIFGADVWEELAGRGDAVHSADGLSGAYLHQLLDLTHRPYTLGEVTEKFWRDPVFPIIPNDSVARRAIFDALRDHGDGISWELVTTTGEPLDVRSPDELAINSHDQLLRLTEPASPTSTGTSPASGAAAGTAATPDGTATGTPGPTTATEGSTTRTDTGGGTGTEKTSGPVVYKAHTLQLKPRSLTDPTTRQRLSGFLAALFDVVDPSSGEDVQMASFTIEINAADGALDDIRPKADVLDITWTETIDDL